jgi:competence protein ComFC
MCHEVGVIQRTVKKITRVLVDLIYPPSCPLCNSLFSQHDRPCDDCQASLLKIDGAAHLHHLPRVWIDRCISCYAYEGGLREAIHGFKYQERFDLLNFLARGLSHTAAGYGNIDAICPVPMHPRRLKSRGYNPAALLAARVGQELNTTVCLNLLRCIRYTPCQMELTQKERLANVKGAFAIADNGSVRLEGKTLLVIDDVLTTGATANECARVLKKNGVSHVAVLTVARTL